MTQGPVAAAAPDLARGCRVVLAGWYGAANLGDELILSVFVDWVREAGGVPRVISVHPHFTAAMLDVETASYTSLADVVEAVAQADLLVLGGGGLFQDYDVFDRPSLARFPARNVSQFAQFFLLAAELGVATAVLGQGVGPLRNADAREITAEVFTRADVCSVRDGESAQLLQAIGVKRSVSIAPDPAWHFALPAPSTDLAARFSELEGLRVMAIVLRDWPFDAHWEEDFVAAFRHALPAGWACLWLDFSRTPSADPDTVQGSEIAHRLIPKLADGRVHAVWQGMRVDEAASWIASCDAMVAMRLHAALLGHLAGLPVVALEYDDKVRVLGDELRIPASQRMPLAEIGERLPPALRRVCGVDGSPYRVDVSVRDELGRSARAHRDLLWQAMGTAARANREAPPATPLLSRWIAADAQAAGRVTAALARRRDARVLRRSV